MKLLEKAFELLAGAFLILNVLGGIVSGIWLAILGHWSVIGLGLLAAITSHFGLAIVLLPCVPLGVGAAAAMNRNSRFAFYSLSVLSNLYVVAAMTAWCLWVMVYFNRRADAHSWIPMLLWSYGVATGPWAYMASKESEGGGGGSSVAAVFSGQVAYVAVMLMVAIGQPTLGAATTTFAAIMLLGVVIQLASGFKETSRFFQPRGLAPHRPDADR